ncbi:MAG: anthraniloyl-CoA monooxygenase [Acidimicrobiaceae bacterium]|nr:MAG: anthraniloyl-CoA monooxygenase [Acidimicrobiaceae bacterium]
MYPFSATHSTFIVETSRATWERAGLSASANQAGAQGQTDQHALEFCRALFAEHLDGEPLLGNNSKWLEFNIVKNDHWYSGRRVLLGDAAHTAHFSIGSGTKLAFEDSIALADALNTSTNVDKALAAYEADRRPKVESLQRAAVTSQRWFENTDRYIGLPSEQFAFQLLTRSQRITYDNLFVRDPGFAAEILGWCWRTAWRWRRWRSTARSMACPPTGTSSTSVHEQSAAPDS